VGAVSAAALAADSKTAPVKDPAPAKPLQASYWGPSYYDENEKQQVADVFAGRNPFRWYGPEPPLKVATFEREFAAKMQTRFALAVTSGTAALQCAVNGLGLGPGDEVILPAWTWHSCYAAIVLAGALPVFAEIDESFNIDPSDIERRITPNTKAIIAVHLQGNPCDLDPVLAVARKHNLRVIEDCAQSVGASYKNRRVGSMGDIGIYSLQLNKTITAGEGGAVVTSDPLLFERAARFHDVGMIRPLHVNLVGEQRLNPFVGTNFRMNEFSGGVLLAQLRKLDRIIADARANVRRVYDGISDLRGIRLRKRPDPAGEIGVGAYIEFASKEQCDRFKAGMKAEGVPASPPSGSAILPVQPYIEKKWTVHAAWPTFTSARGKEIQYGAAACPRTIDILSRFAGVLIDPKWTSRETDRAVAAIRKVYPTAA
jgi:8-amino-3,8-dideoxy-alpha-D-manno-octulosonate transaminase